jgi:hypothetical protein
MLKQFTERYDALIKENAQLGEKIKQNEIQALKLQGAIETLNYIAQEGEDESPGEETVAE